jgi:hypothetical protein
MRAKWRGMVFSVSMHHALETYKRRESEAIDYRKRVRIIFSGLRTEASSFQI